MNTGPGAAITKFRCVVLNVTDVDDVDLVVQQRLPFREKGTCCTSPFAPIWIEAMVRRQG